MKLYAFMRRLEVNHHSSVVIIESEKTSEFLFSVYDNTYPMTCFRGAINLIGGNYEAGDKSPLDILCREIKQELSTNQNYTDNKETNLSKVMGMREKPQKIKLFADKRVIARIREEVISSAIPYKDYLLNFPSFEGRKQFDALTSVFISVIRQNIFELARKNLAEGKSIKNEGLAVICSIEDIIKGRFFGAWATPCILADYKNVILPNPFGAEAKPIGKPKSSMLGYINEFKHKIPIYETINNN